MSLVKMEHCYLHATCRCVCVIISLKSNGHYKCPICIHIKTLDVQCLFSKEIDRSVIEGNSSEQGLKNESGKEKF